MYAVIKTGGKQYRVQQGDRLRVEKLAGDVGGSVTLDEVLMTLSPKKRVVFVLLDLEGLTSPEASAVLGVPEATVRTRLFYARQEIAAALRTHPGFADIERVHR